MKSDVVQKSSFKIYFIAFFLVKIFLRDPHLAMECLFGPATAYRYRLTGPEKWAGARVAIIGQNKRTFYPLTDGKCTSWKRKHCNRVWPCFLLFGIAVTLCGTLFSKLN